MALQQSWGVGQLDGHSMRKQPENIDWRSFFERFRGESDRACAVLGRALMEDLLRRLLESRLLDGTDAQPLFEGSGPLATFAARIRICRALGWLSEDDARDLHRVRDIGNDFAHHLDHTMSFEDQNIRDRVASFRCPAIMTRFGAITTPPVSPPEIADIESRPRRRFEVAIGILQHIITQAISASTRPQDPIGLISQLESTGLAGKS
jgi:DNA-binding MltR family transcriptional regulator